MSAPPPSSPAPPPSPRPSQRPSQRPSPGPSPGPLWSAHLPAAAWLVVMTVALAVPSDTADLPSWWPRILHFQALDKVIHGLLFAVAALLLARSFRHLAAIRRPLLAALLATALYGGVTEVGQHLLTDRSGELADVAADVAGAALGTLAATLLRPPLRTPGAPS